MISCSVTTALQILSLVKLGLSAPLPQQQDASLTIPIPAASVPSSTVDDAAAASLITPFSSTDSSTSSDVAPVPASGLITFISGVLTTPYQCGSYASNNVCATGYACIDGKCVKTSAAESSTASDATTAALPVPAADPATVVEPSLITPAAPVQPEVVAAPAPVVDTPPPAVYTPPPPPPPPPTSWGTLTFYDPSTGGGYCNGVTYSSSSFVVALATDILSGRCGSTITLVASNGNSVQATVVDMCNMADGCTSGNIDTTTAVWHALGLDTGAGRIGIQYHF